MKKIFIKMITLCVVGATLTGLVGCGTDDSSASSSSASASSASTESTASSSTESSSNKNASSSKENNTKQADSDGKFTKEALPLFEKLYASDAQKDFKISFAKETLANFDKIQAVLPKDLNDALFTSKQLVKFEGPMYQYSFQATVSKDKPSKTDCLAGVIGELSFYDDKKNLLASSELSISFKTGSDTEVKLNDEAKELVKTAIPDSTPEEIESKINESFKNKGKSIYLIEEKNKNLTISSFISDKGNNYAQVSYELSKDYPQ